MVEQKNILPKGGVTEFLEEHFPEEAKTRKKIKEELNKEALEARSLLAQNGDIWGLLYNIPSKYLLTDDNRDFLIQAARKCEAGHPEPTMQYKTFIYYVENAETSEEILHAVPRELSKPKLKIEIPPEKSPEIPPVQQKPQSIFSKILHLHKK